VISKDNIVEIEDNIFCDSIIFFVWEFFCLLIYAAN
jgi:hypothetical protein